MIKAFVQTGKSEYSCPECGGGMVTETIPFNVVVHKCLDCKTIHTKEYLAGWYDAANEFCNIKSESFGEFRSTIAALTTRLQEAEAIIKPLAEHYAKWPVVGEVAIFLPSEHYARAAAFLAGGDPKEI